MPSAVIINDRADAARQLRPWLDRIGMSCDLVDSYRDAESLISYYQSTTGRSPDLLIGPMSSAGWGFLQFLQSRQSTIRVAFYTEDADRSRDDELCQTSGCLAILHAPFDETVKQVLRKNGFTTASTGTGTTSRGPGAPQTTQPGSASFGKTGSATSRFQRPAPSAAPVNPPSGFAPTVAPNPADTIPGFSPGTARFMAPAAPRSGALLLIDDDAGRVQELYSYLLEKQIPAKMVGSYGELETALTGGGFLMIIGPLYTEGVDLCRRIRAANPAGPQVVFYTNSSPHLQDARLPAQYGCLAIIPMPIPLGVVIELVKAQTAPPAAPPSATAPPMPVAQQQPNQRGTVMLTRPQPGARGTASYNASTSRNTNTARISQANLQPGDALGPPTGGQAPANSPSGAANVRNRVSVSSTQRPIQPMKSPPPWPTAPAQNEAPQWPAPAPSAAPQFPQPPQFTNQGQAPPAPQFTNPPQFPQFPQPAAPQADAQEPDGLLPLPPAPQPLAPPVTATQARPPITPVQTRPPSTTQQPARAIAPATSRVSRLGSPSAAGPSSAPATSRLARPPSVNTPAAAPPAAATPPSARPAPLPAKPLPAQPIDQTPDWMAEEGAAPARPASPAPAPTAHDDPHPAMTGTMRLRRSVRGPSAPSAQPAMPAAENPAPPAPSFTAPAPTPAPVATPRALSSPMPMAAPTANFRPALPTPPASQRADDDFPFADEQTVSMPLLEAAEAEETRPEPDIVFEDAAPKVKTRQLVVVCARCGEDFIATVPEGERAVACVNCGHINTTTG